jgi:hypothetical protein
MKKLTEEDYYARYNCNFPWIKDFWNEPQNYSALKRQEYPKFPPVPLVPCKSLGYTTFDGRKVIFGLPWTKKKK